MGYVQVTFGLKENVDCTVLSAYLEWFDVDSIWEEERQLHAYFLDEVIEKYNGDFEAELLDKCGDFVTDMSVSIPESINWNKEWESNFPTVEVDDFCLIYADFHEVKRGFEHNIKIAPKMAFGTGHHETTYMMIQGMRKENFINKMVLDLGCGTGILSVLAAKMGSTDIDAIDIELPSYENTLEHAEMNEVALNVFHGGVEDVPNKTYDIILANINRNVLLTYSVSIISALSSKNGVLFLSGILEQDKPLILEAYSELELVEIKNRGIWLCFKFLKKVE